jgi:hypothetical protein
MVVIGTFSRNGNICTVARRWSMDPVKQDIADFLCREVMLPQSSLEDVVVIEDESVVDRFSPKKTDHRSMSEIIDWINSL